jgi:hypothetical protein
MKNFWFLFFLFLTSCTTSVITDDKLLPMEQIAYVTSTGVVYYFYDNEHQAECYVGNTGISCLRIIK